MVLDYYSACFLTVLNLEPLDARDAAASSLKNTCKAAIYEYEWVHP